MSGLPPEDYWHCEFCMTWHPRSREPFRSGNCVFCDKDCYDKLCAVAAQEEDM